jgi:hypothetical protein
VLSLLRDADSINKSMMVGTAGDHGLSLPNDGGITPYDNPHIGSFKVPIVIAHPHWSVDLDGWELRVCNHDGDLEAADVGVVIGGDTGGEGSCQ